MLEKNIERKFEKRFEGVLQFVSDYEDFTNLSVGACASISPKEEDKSFGCYFEGSEIIDENTQRVFIQYVPSKGRYFPHQKQMKNFVVEYHFPISGEISIEDFKAEKKYKVE
ncbi:hypothetical protein GW931_00325 [archaeon]|nr:hypothetical protein [archaeon]PJC45534.1 MAG: hypothetical protein CO037_01000 [Candidatus Pacearchaeota archaeon CG_4_9_14_0_2_um_filter_30_8]